MDARGREEKADVCRTLDDRVLEQLAYSDKMAELGRLAVGVIHEINTPLSVIAAAAQLIMREEELPEHVVELVERINGEAQRLSLMSRGILSFGRLDGGGGGETDINLVVRDVTQLLTYEIRKRGIVLHQDPDYRIPQVVIDAGRVKQVLINLVMNAVQAMEAGGVLMIRTVSVDESRCDIQVSDTGCGISSDNLEHIFEPFFTTKRSGEGTGLGLYITREIVKSLGGSIAVESTPGHGACFTVTLPLTDG